MSEKAERLREGEELRKLREGEKLSSVGSEKRRNCKMFYEFVSVKYFTVFAFDFSFD